MKTALQIARDLEAKGYRVISNRSRIISRIDREDWKDSVTGFYGQPIEDGKDWAHIYRCTFSKDKQRVSSTVCVKMKLSLNDDTGYITLNESKTLTAKTLREILSQGYADKANGICPMCKEKIQMDGFTDALSITEYNISGYCQKCQDIIFKGEEEG